MNVTRAVAIAGMAGLGALACDVRQPYPDADTPSVTIHVTNDRQADVDLFVLRPDGMEKVGHLCGEGTMEIAVGAALVREGVLTVLVDPEDTDQNWQTPGIMVLPQTEVEIRVGPVLGESSYSVHYGEEEPAPLFPEGGTP
jgi:hypothetical protein